MLVGRRTLCLQDLSRICQDVLTRSIMKTIKQSLSASVFLRLMKSALVNLAINILILTVTLKRVTSHFES